MKPLLLWTVALVLSVTASLVAVRFDCTSCDAAPPADSDATARLAEIVARLDSKQDDLAKSLDELRSQYDADTRGDARVPVGEIEAAVARALGKPAPVAVAEETPATGAKAATARDFLDRLLADDLSREDTEAIWKEATDAGHLDELVALFEARAKAEPGSPDAQLDLGRAYLHKVFKAGNGPEAGVWATKADDSFDAALALDDHHWEARFSKAVSLSFWPPVFGKQTEAIKHFEILIEQQANSASSPNHAQTWLLLGNMYQQLGKSDQALATWQRGLALFPDNGQLAQQIANGQGNGSGN